MKEVTIKVANKPDIGAGMIAGFVASVASILVLAFSTFFILVPEFDYIAIQGSAFGLAGGSLAAWISYFLIGIFIWGVLYAIVESLLNGSSRNAKGLLFGSIIWLVVMIVLMPLADAGFFLKEYGFIAALIILITDLSFGLVMSYSYDKFRRM